MTLTRRERQPDRRDAGDAGGRTHRGQVAERFGITVRTLHHYDEIGLLIPSRRAASGYRVYTSGT
ncbi:merR regulatory family protein [Mycobacterium ulcerans str. Harvey]|uniref:MerR regulatory family protein n=1 Tax=Mycobacterium ulcerans str. Harvey TaxID=1299332 RepID=A0ABP3ARU4_MYCUL|nr:merR regulatory family protein [Mycobacterium ulcerans str. Harvey]